jgi:hypothetical protein
MRTVLMILVIGLAISDVGHAQEARSVDASRLSETLLHLRNGDQDAKETAFDELMEEIASENLSEPTYITEDALARFLSNHPDQADDVKLGLIQLLVQENDSPDEDHYPLVIDAVASLNDERTIPALVGAMTTGGMAQSGLIKYGSRALEPIFEQLKGPNALMRASALGTAVTILKRGDASSRRQVKGLLQSSLRDSESVVRAEAILLIECLPERRDYMPSMEKLSTTDPTRYPGKSDDGVDGDWYYPVRVQARRVLRAIQNNTVCRP